MGRTDSRETKEKILKAAEALFSDKGYDGTGIEEIASTAGVNKALIYYHFKNKEGLLFALYGQIMDEVKILVGRSFLGAGRNNRGEVKEALREILRLLREKSPLLKILLMESLKGGRSEKVFMDLARLLMEGELEEMEYHGGVADQRDRFLVFEFYTGFMPIYNYAVMGDTWSEHFGLDGKRGEEYFLDSFMATHLAHHNFK